MITKRISILFRSMLIAGTIAAGISASVSAQAAEKKKEDPIQVVTTIFPEYDWVMNIIGENAENVQVTMLLDNGVDLHSYQPTADDIIKISNCDLFVYVGGESDAWVEDALKEAVNKDMVVLNLLQILGEKVKTEEIVEGMEHDHEHEHEDEEDHDHEGEEEHEGEEDHDHEGEEEHEDEEEHDHEHDEEPDEHVWLSLKNTQELCDAIAAALSQIDSGNAEQYQANVDAYKDQLAALDAEYEALVSEAASHTLLFGDRFPFRYLTDDYGLEYYAAFSGCSAETEASFETIIFLSGKVDELGLSSIMTIDGSDQKLAETIKNSTASKDQEILALNSMQSTTAKNIKEGTTYLSVMTSNLDVLKEALN